MGSVKLSQTHRMANSQFFSYNKRLCLYQAYLEAATQRRSWEKVFWKYAANLQENTRT